MATKPEPEGTAPQDTLRDLVEVARRLTPDQQGVALTLLQRLAERRPPLLPMTGEELAAMRAAYPDQAWFWTRAWYEGERDIDVRHAMGERGAIYFDDDE